MLGPLNFINCQLRVVGVVVLVEVLLVVVVVVVVVVVLLVLVIVIAVLFLLLLLLLPSRQHEMGTTVPSSTSFSWLCRLSRLSLSEIGRSPISPSLPEMGLSPVSLSLPVMSLSQLSLSFQVISHSSGTAYTFSRTLPRTTLPTWPRGGLFRS